MRETPALRLARRISRLRPADRRRGFTLIELMVVIVILGMLVALVGPNVWHALTAGSQGTAEAQMSNIDGAIQMYVMENRSLPNSLEDLTQPNKKTGEPYLKDLPNDPWGQKYEFQKGSGSRDYKIISGGEDKKIGTEDDLVWPKPKEGK